MNMALFTPRNFVVIAVFSVIAYMVFQHFAKGTE